MSGRGGIAWAALLLCFAGNARAAMTISLAPARLDGECRVFGGTDGVRLHPWFVHVVRLGEPPARARAGERFGLRFGGDLRDADYDRHLNVYSHGFRRCSSRLWIAKRIPSGSTRRLRSPPTR
jgi:hypothetical protein